MDKDDTINNGIFLDTPKWRASMDAFYYSLSSQRHHHHHHQHHYRRSEKGYFPEELEKPKPPTFYGETTKSKDTKSWLLGMRNFFRLLNYL